MIFSRRGWCSPPRICAFWFCIVIILQLTLLLKERNDLLPLNLRKNVVCPACWFKEDILKDLNEVHLEMQTLLTHHQAPSATLVQRLGEIVKHLDNKHQSKTTETMRSDESVDVCPEVFNNGGRREGYPFFADKGWQTINCANAKPIRSVISILVNTVAYPQEDETHIKNVLKGITESYPTVQVHLATRSSEVVEAAKRYKNVDAFMVNDDKLSKAWNTLNSKVSTPYVLVARDVFHFTWLTQLERQIRVISQTPDVGVVGGAYRNLLGHWKAGCVQTKLTNYVLEYQEGYYHSKNECMFCDYLQGPFVAKTNLLKFDEGLPNEVIFEDWFLRVAEDGNLIMSCPDAMYFTSDYHSYSKRSDKNVWTPLAKKWELNRVLLPQGVKHSFSCREVGFRCKAREELLPVCCQEEFTDALSFFQSFADMHNISFELDSGSVLGGVKFNGLLPWDLDGDLLVLASDIDIFNKSETIKHFKKNGYTLRFKPPVSNQNGALALLGLVKIEFNGFHIDVSGSSVLSNTVYLPAELQYQGMFTKAYIRGNWIVTKFSPGLYARNRYGREVLKHSQSWLKVGLMSSFGVYRPGSFTQPCKRPRHHSCLQNYPGDGDIPFLVT